MSQRRRLPTRSQMEAYTPFRTKYGYLDGYENTNKSGLTPTQYIFPGDLTDSKLESQIKLKEKLQQEALFGWTTRELADLDCLTIRDAKQGDLESIPILPLLNRPVWETSPAPEFERTYMYVLTGNRGDIAAHNDLIWEALKPALRIASFYLSSVYMLPFFDALLNGPRELIPEYRKMQNDKRKGPFYSFRPPDNPTHPSVLSTQRDFVFDDLRINKRLQIGFMSTDESPEDPDGPWFDGMVHGYTTVNNEFMHSQPKASNAAWRVFLFLNSIGIERLLEDDLNSSERVMIEWFLALTLSHEIIHAVQYWQGINRGGWTEQSIQKNYEPYYMDQPIAELGWCFEKEINGGIQETMGKKELKFTRGLQLGQFFIPTWPSMRSKNVRDSDTITLLQPHPSLYDIRYPVPLSLMEDLQTQNFWNLGVRNFGIQLLFLRVFKVGTRTTYIFNTKKVMEEKPPDPYTKEGRASISTTIDQKVVFTTSNLQQLAFLSPKQRSIAEFGHALILSSNRDSTFWAESQKKAGAMQNINDLLYRDPRIRTPFQGFGMIFNDILPHAITNHENMITFTIEMEDERESVNSARRKSLIAWNKGTTRFVRQMVKEVQSVNSGLPTPEADDFLIKLERGRLRLANPNPSDDTTDEDDLLHLRLGKCKKLLATSDPSMAEAQQMETLANSVLGDEDSTILACACAKILIAVLGSRIAHDWNGRVSVGGGAAMKSFGALAQTEGEDIGKLWKDEINAWQAMLIRVAQIGPPQ